MSDSLAQFGARLHKLATSLDAKDIMNKVALAAKKEIQAEIRQDVGADMRMSGWKSVKHDVGYEFESDTKVVFTPRRKGPAQVLEQGRRSGQIPKRAKRKTVKTPWGPRTFTRAHPMKVGRTAGKHTFSHAETKISRSAPRNLHDEIVNKLRDAF